MSAQNLCSSMALLLVTAVGCAAAPPAQEPAKELEAGEGASAPSAGAEPVEQTTARPDEAKAELGQPVMEHQAPEDWRCYQWLHGANSESPCFRTLELCQREYESSEQKTKRPCQVQESAWCLFARGEERCFAQRRDCDTQIAKFFADQKATCVQVPAR